MSSIDLTVPPPVDWAPPQVAPVATTEAPTDLMPSATNLGRDKLVDWHPSLWLKMDEEVRCEIDRACIAAKFLPRVPSLSPSERTVPEDRIQEADSVLSIDKSKVLPLLEVSQSFLLSKEQYFEEGTLGTGVTLASRASNRIAEAMDTALFQGKANPSLVTVAAKNHIVPVPPLDPKIPGVYGENAFKAVAEAYAFLQQKNFYGPYALVVFADQFADAHAPLPTTLIMPADRIRPLMTAGFYGTGTIPAKQGVMVSVGGSTVDIAITVHGATAFTQIDEKENYRFRVYERFTGRIKDTRALVLLQYK